MVIGVIPARLESTRFPRKILFPIRNKPMIMHVYECALQAQLLDKVIIAIDSTETANFLAPYGAEIMMTSTTHRSGTDRVAEVMQGIDADIIINIQGDEPMLDPTMIDKLISSFDDKEVEIATLASTIITKDDFKNPNTVKVNIDRNNNAVGFYREITDERAKYFRHIGIYGYRKETLMAFTNFEQSENEKKDSLEQLRALDNGIPIRVVKFDFEYRGIDTIDDLRQLKL
jgi:3-deoxy-manno-octulosonate cytidylyltransferase (CMP-KDO synthetase)